MNLFHHYTLFYSIVDLMMVYDGIGDGDEVDISFSLCPIGAVIAIFYFVLFLVGTFHPWKLHEH